MTKQPHTAARPTDKARPRKRNTERVLTLHPREGALGTNIERSKYDAMRRALLRVIGRAQAGIPFSELSALVRPQLPPEVFGPGVSVTWYTVTVKLDLEARGLIERVPGSRPQRVRRSAS